MNKEILRLPAVISRTGLSRSTIYLKVSNDTFPKPIKLSQRSIGWIASDINAWIDQRIKDSEVAE